MYTTHNYKTKKALIADFKAGEKVTCYQPGPFAQAGGYTGEYTIEGPHGYHTWYCRVVLHDGVIVKILP